MAAATSKALLHGASARRGIVTPALGRSRDRGSGCPYVRPHCAQSARTPWRGSPASPPLSPTGGAAPAGPTPATGQAGGGIFGEGEGDGDGIRTTLSNPATSPLNLIGKLEGWGIGPATAVKEVRLKISSATGAQLKELLKKLPDGMTFELTLEKEDG